MAESTPALSPSSWDSERKRRTANTVDVIQRVAAELGGTVSYVGIWLAVIDVERVRLDVYFDDSTDRLEIKIHQPSFTNDHGAKQRYGDRIGGDVKITVSSSRPAARLAADIRRRILPAAHDYYPKWLAQAARYTDRAAQSERFRQLAESIGGHRGPFGDVSGQIQPGATPFDDDLRWRLESVHGSRGKLIISGVTPAVFEQVLFLLGEFREEAGE